MAQPNAADQGGTAPRQNLRVSAGAVASSIGVALLVVFMAQNSEDVRLDFLFWTFTWPLWVVCAASAVTGALIWFGLGVVRRHRRRASRREARGA